METVKRIKSHKGSLIILAGLLCFFFGLFAACDIGIYNDSEQYITMHIHREPLYPLFLAFFRVLVPTEGYLTVAVAAQNILAVFGIWILSEYLARHFSLKWSGELALVFVQLIPYLMTAYASALHIFMQNSIMSEALCIPLFQIYLYFAFRMIFEWRGKDIALCLVFAYLLSMTRGQMMSTILMWMVIVAICLLVRRKYRLLFVPVLVTLLVFGLRSLSVHVYNYGVTGYFMGNTYGKVNTLTNVMYACDWEDSEVFEEGSLEGDFFKWFYSGADAVQANYKYGGDTFQSRADHLEASHDTLKFDVIETDFSAYYFGYWKQDYYEQNRASDEVAANMIKKLLPECFGQWLYDYVLLCTYGFIRSIAVVHPLLNPVVLFLYAAAVGLGIFRLRFGEKKDSALVMGVALLFIAANVCATSLTIMCLSRYMIYGFALFYMALFLLAVEQYRDWRQGRLRLGQGKRKENKRG